MTVPAIAAIETPECAGADEEGVLDEGMVGDVADDEGGPAVDVGELPSRQLLSSEEPTTLTSELPP